MTLKLLMISQSEKTFFFSVENSRLIRLRTARQAEAERAELSSGGDGENQAPGRSAESQSKPTMIVLRERKKETLEFRRRLYFYQQQQHHFFDTQLVSTEDHCTTELTAAQPR